MWEKKYIVATITIGREILCLPYAGSLFVNNSVLGYCENLPYLGIWIKIAPIQILKLYSYTQTIAYLTTLKLLFLSRTSVNLFALLPNHTRWHQQYQKKTN